MPDKDDRVNPQVRYSSREEIATDEEHRPLISSGAESKPCNGVRGQGKLGDPTSEHDLDNDPDSAIPLLPLEAAEKAEVFPPTVIKIQGHVDGSGANGCRPKTSLVEPPCSALWPSDGSVVNGMGVQAVNQKLPGRHSNGTPVVYVTDRVATTYSAVPTVAVAPLYSQAPTCPVKGAHGSRMGVRLQGTHHVFTIVPVGSGELLAEQQQQQEGKAEAKAPLPQAVVSSSAPAPRHPAVVVSSSASFSAPTQRQALCTATAAPVRKISASSMRAVPTIPMSMVATLPTGLDPPLNNYRTVVAPPNMAVNYNPYHTITGMVPSTYPGREYGVGGGVSFLPQREYGVGSSPFYQRGEYGVGGGVPPSLGPVLAQRGPLGVPPSLAPVVAPRGPVTSSLHGAGAVSSPPKGMQRVATMPCSSRPMAYHMASRPLSPQGGWVGPVPLQPPTSEQLTVHSVNQMTVQSAGGLSIDVGSTDGRNVTVRGALTSPDQLPYLPAVFRHGHQEDNDGMYDGAEARQTWANKAQFVLACIGYAVGLGNLWRFPYLCYKSGGGAFLIPYFLMLFLCGIPLLLMELTLGQYTRRGPIGALEKICPLFKGAGVGTVIMSFLLGTYYNVIIAWAIFYLFQSFTIDLPWRNCNATWAITCFDDYGVNITAPNGTKSATEEFFDEVVLEKSAGIEEMGTMRLELVLALLGAWALVYFSLWKSVKSSGKVVYVTATLPYLLIGAFLWRALTLPGASTGLRYFFSPRWELLGKAEVWVNAAAQNFNSIGIAFGSLIAFSSYNKFNNNIVLDTWAISLTNSFTSLLSGMIVFSTLGNIALEQGKDVDDVVAQGPGLVFMVYPQALAKMPYASLWAILFFFMLLILGLDSQFATVEVIITSLQDGFPRWIQKYLRRHEVLVLVVCFISFLIGLPNVMQGGIYFFQLIDYYAAAVSLMYLAFFEVIGVVWVYGAGRLSRNLREMTGKQPSLYFRFCWYAAAPVLIFAIWIFSIVDYKEPTYNKGEYKYPGWAIGIGWIIASCSILPIPIFAVIAVIKAKGSNIWEKMRNSIRSQIEECPCCGRTTNCLEEAHNAGEEYTDRQVKLVVYNPPMANGDAKAVQATAEKGEESESKKEKDVA